MVLEDSKSSLGPSSSQMDPKKVETWSEKCKFQLVFWRQFPDYNQRKVQEQASVMVWGCMDVSMQRRTLEF